MRLRLLVLRLSFRHVIFDLDGTLIDSAGDLAASANHALGTLGLPRLPQHAIVGFVGNGARKLVERSVAASAGSASVRQVDRALAAFVEHYAAHLLDSTVLHAGLERVLRALSTDGVVLSVATNKPEAMARAILDGLGVGHLFVDVRGGDSVPNHKPDPAMLHALAARTGIGRRDTLLVGDSLVDVATARAGGVAVCAVEWGLTPTDVLRDAAPDFLICRADELLAIVS